MEPSEIANGCFLSVLTRERDPSETVSVKDVLARAAAKGLLEGIELGKSSKREKKKKSKTAFHKTPTTESKGIQMKIAEFLNRETKANVNRIKPATTKITPQAKSTIPVVSSSQVNKPTKPAASSLVPALMKNPSFPRPQERPTNIVRPTNFGRPRPEDKMVVLKPVEIVLPPVMFPSSPSPGVRSHTPTQHFYYRWFAPGYHSTPLATRKAEKPKGNLPSSLLRHRRPWL